MLATLIYEGAALETDACIIIGLEIELEASGYSFLTATAGPLETPPPPIISRKDPLDASSFSLSSYVRGFFAGAWLIPPSSGLLIDEGW